MRYKRIGILSVQTPLCTSSRLKTQTLHEALFDVYVKIENKRSQWLPLGDWDCPININPKVDWGLAKLGVNKNIE